MITAAIKLACIAYFAYIFYTANQNMHDNVNPCNCMYQWMSDFSNFVFAVYNNVRKMPSNIYFNWWSVDLCKSPVKGIIFELPPTLHFCLTVALKNKMMNYNNYYACYLIRIQLCKIKDIFSGKWKQKIINDWTTKLPF